MSVDLWDLSKALYVCMYVCFGWRVQGHAWRRALKLRLAVLLWITCQSCARPSSVASAPVMLKMHEEAIKSKKSKGQASLSTFLFLPETINHAFFAPLAN